MLLVDSLYINIGGGKILLDYFVSELEKNKFNVFYLFDIRCKNDYKYIPDNRKLYMKSNLKNRMVFYVKYKKMFSKVFCFGNIPPPIDLNGRPVFTYFHQRLFVEDFKFKYLLSKISLLAKTTYIKLIKRNTEYWLVQNLQMKSGLIDKYKISSERIKLLPFFSPLPKTDTIKINNSYAYISLSPPHKNHLRLIEAWELLNDQGFQPILHLTVPNDSSEVYNKIIQAKLKGVKIENHGYVSRYDVSNILRSSQYLIFPSLVESFGLPLLEGIEAGCKVIAADLEYTNHVIVPSYTFNPFSSKSIADAVKYSINNILPPSKAKVKNEINDLLKLLAVK